MEKDFLIIRKAEINDIPMIQKITREVFELYVQCARIPGSSPALEESYEDIKKDMLSKECFVAEYNNVIVGSVRVEVKEDKTAYLSRFGVALDHQNGGVGKKLMEAVDEAMVNLKVKKLYLHTASKLLSLVRFYYNRGFYVESTSKDKGYIRALLCKEYTEGSYKKSPVYGTHAI